MYPSHSKKTPLLCAAEAGHDEIVAYLLEFRTVQTDLESQPGKVYNASVSTSFYLESIDSYGTGTQYMPKRLI